MVVTTLIAGVLKLCNETLLKEELHTVIPKISRRTMSLRQLLELKIKICKYSMNLKSITPTKTLTAKQRITQHAKYHQTIINPHKHLKTLTIFSKAQHPTAIENLLATPPPTNNKTSKSTRTTGTEMKKK